MLTIKSAYTFDQYVKLNFTLFFQNRAVFFLLFVAGLNIFRSALQLLGIINGYEDPWSVIIIILLLIGVILFSLYRLMKKGYENKNFYDYTFTDKDLKVKGQGYFLETSWEQINRVKQLKEWIIIYPKGLNHEWSIRKESFSDEQLSELYRILRSKQHIKLI